MISAFPPVHLDVALVVDAIGAGRRRHPRRCATAAASCWSRCGCSTSTPATRSPAGHKSLAFALVVRAPDRTLTAAEATAVRDRAVARGRAAGRRPAGLRSAVGRLGAALRGRWSAVGRLGVALRGRWSAAGSSCRPACGCAVGGSPTGRTIRCDFLLALADGPTPPWTVRRIDWPDFRLPRDRADALAALADGLRRAREGQRVEVACLGGRGRTGTALAAMAVLDGMDPAAAVPWVRRVYHAEGGGDARPGPVGAHGAPVTAALPVCRCAGDRRP